MPMITSMSIQAHSFFAIHPNVFLNAINGLKEHQHQHTPHYLELEKADPTRL